MSKKEQKTEWTKQRKRIFQRVLSLLKYWENGGFNILWITLTSSDLSNPDELSYNHKKLVQRLRRELSRQIIDFQYVVIRTGEGNGTLHIFWAIKIKRGFRVFIRQKRLSREWEDLHNASVVWIKRYRHRTSKRVSRYCATQYVSNQPGSNLRLFWSWGRIGKLVKVWKFILKHSSSFKEALLRWDYLLKGNVLRIKWYLLKPYPLRIIELSDSFLNQYIDID